LAPQDSPNRPRDITRIQRSGRNLVEQGLEQVMVSAIDQRDPHRRIAERTRRSQAAEPAANDHNVWKTHRRSTELFLTRIRKMRGGKDEARQGFAD
jgi:hypothetical protein